MKIETVKKPLRHSTVQFVKDTVVKVSTPDLLHIEVAKTRLAFEIGRRCGLFQVPKVIQYDQSNGTAVFELLDIKPILKAVLWGVSRINLARYLGSSLAIIHRELLLPDHLRVPLPKEFAFPYDEVFLHGDLSVSNVCVRRSSPSLVIIDWQMTPLYGGKATHGTRYFDILWFVNNLINNPSARFVFGNPVQPIVNIFMESYFQEAQLCYESDMIITYAKRFFDIEMTRIRRNVIKKSRGRARLLFPCSQRILKEFMKSLETFKPRDRVLSHSKDF